MGSSLLKHPERQLPRELKLARKHKIKRLGRWPEGQLYPNGSCRRVFHQALQPETRLCFGTKECRRLKAGSRIVTKPTHDSRRGPRLCRPSGYAFFQLGDRVLTHSLKASSSRTAHRTEFVSKL